MKPNFDKLLISARYWILGMAQNDESYYKVSEALEFALIYHNGKRNGGDHEFIHQLGIFHNLRTLHRHIENPVNVYILAFLHDVVEDKNVPLEEIASRFGTEIAQKVDLLSKEVLCKKKENYSLNAAFADVDASIVKIADRINNVSSMVGVFKQARLLRYYNETNEIFFPLIKEARRNFPHQEAIYENFKLQLVNQLLLVGQLLNFMPDEPK